MECLDGEKCEMFHVRDGRPYCERYQYDIKVVAPCPRKRGINWAFLLCGAMIALGTIAAIAVIAIRQGHIAL